MKLNIVKIKGAKNVEENRAEKMEMLERNIIESCIRSIAEADAIALLTDMTKTMFWN